MKKNAPAEKSGAKKPAGKSAEQRPIKEKLGKFFEKYDLRDEGKIRFAFKWLVFGLVLFVETLMLLQMIDSYKQKGEWSLWVFIGGAAGLALAEGVNHFVAKRVRTRVVCYSFEFVFVIVLGSLAGNTYLSVLYMILATGLYFNTRKMLPSVASFLVCLLAYTLAYSAVAFFGLGVSLTTMQVVTQSFGALGALTVHFFVFKFVWGFYTQYVRLTQALKELDETNVALEKANSELAEAAVLAERQRIAKDIHDTAGHSITTVIMQTEVAKLIIDKDPQGAKEKIVAANLQAKHTLEELRESVHLLSGASEKEPLKSALQRIITESTDGTGIKIRSQIEAVDVSDELFRFITNALKEGISNGLRHGKATAFWFELKRTDGEIEFLLSDNGVGGDTQTIQEGFGLSGMKKEAVRLGGTARFSAEKDEGFEIYLKVPLKG